MLDVMHFQKQEQNGLLFSGTTKALHIIILVRSQNHKESCLEKYYSSIIPNLIAPNL